MSQEFLGEQGALSSRTDLLSHLAQGGQVYGLIFTP